MKTPSFSWSLGRAAVGREGAPWHLLRDRNGGAAGSEAIFRLIISLSSLLANYFRKRLIYLCNFQIDWIQQGSTKVIFVHSFLHLFIIFPSCVCQSNPRTLLNSAILLYWNSKQFSTHSRCKKIMLLYFSEADAASSRDIYGRKAAGLIGILRRIIFMLEFIRAFEFPRLKLMVTKTECMIFIFYDDWAILFIIFWKILS